MATFDLKINGRTQQVTCDASTPLLYVLRNDVGLNGPKFGCGLGQCGACSVLMDGEVHRSCVTSVGDVGKAEIRTLDGMAEGEKLHPVQAAFIAEQAAQCGYCTNGMIMSATALLEKNKDPSEAEIRAALSDLLCRCGVHNRVVKAVKRAAGEMKI